MIFLFIHQNFPAQYRHVARHLAAQPEHDVYFLTQPNQNEMPGVRKLVYEPDLAGGARPHPFAAALDAAVRTGLAVAERCRELRNAGTTPDIIIGHGGWGETLFVKDVFPDVPLLSYFEFFYHSRGADVGFDPEFAPCTENDGPRLSVLNAVNRLTFAGTDWGHTATRWQRSLYPAPMQARITTIHEGVDTRHVRPDPAAWLRLARQDLVLTREDEVITYVARNLEPYRGFHIFMRALPEILRRRPQAHVMIVGGDGVSYGEPLPGGESYRELLLAEVGDGLDLDRVHFLGQVPHDSYLNVLQVSSIHVHLTYPFVLSWSFIEAMAAGCLVLGSATAPVLEVLRDGENGLAVDFFDVPGICDRVDAVLDHGDRMQDLRDAARATAVEGFDLATCTLPQWMQLLGQLIDRELPEEEPPDWGPAAEFDVR